ncbi:prolipoprotein diacylglyceryl transferase [Pasteuria penetrans]|uniref:prolipoprotein diacylglyceryl transferase n=1 Tax=Pasteuria penetrans TaxID=86005 RepID=UPI000FBC895B|nr:prolipoprotein diacylglyceryl transferase [Pasteuria penetrans]
MPAEIMDPVILNLGYFKVRWYGLITALALVIATWITFPLAKKYKLDSFFIPLLLLCVPIAVLGGRLYDVIVSRNAMYWEHPLTIIGIGATEFGVSGLSIQGAYLCAMSTGWLFCRHHRISFLRITDIAAPGLLLGEAMGRWGNFINQEAYGSTVPRSFLEDLLLPDWLIEGMYIRGEYHHPTFLYQSLWNILGVGILLALFRFAPKLRCGEIFFAAFLWYALGRFYIEGLRMDSAIYEAPSWIANLFTTLWSPLNTWFHPPTIGENSIRLPQLFSVLEFIGFLSVWIGRRCTSLPEMGTQWGRKKKNTP